MITSFNAKTQKTISIFGTLFPIVSEEEQKNSKNTLYLYAEFINNVQYIKFGEAIKQTVWKRYSATGNTQHDHQIKVWSSDVGDKPIHRLLMNAAKKSINFSWAGKTGENPLNTNEAYIINNLDGLNEIFAIIDNIVANKKIDKDFFRTEDSKTPRQYQLQVMQRLNEAFKHNTDVLLNLSTRAGKSFVSLKFAKDYLKAENILILTPFPSAEGSFEELGELSKEFVGYKYLRLTAKTKKDDFDKNKNIIFCSYQYYNESKENIKVLQNIKIDFLILDEAHNTSDSQRTEKILNQIKAKKTLYMSGTPFNDIESGRFTKENTVTFDFIDFIKYARNHSDEISLPELHIYNVFNMKYLNDKLREHDPKIFDIADAFQFDTIFSDATYATSFFDFLLEDKRFIRNSKWWFNTNLQKKILIFVDNKKECNVVEKSLNSFTSDAQSVFKGYKVVKVSGEGDITESSEEKINDIFAANEKVAIISCQKLTTGVTLPQLDTVWLFRKCRSSEQFIQILFRTMTACNGKTQAAMYCFDSEISLQVLKDFSAIRLDTTNTTYYDTNATYKKILEDMFSCINFQQTYSDGSYMMKWEDATPENYLEKIHNLPFCHTVASIFKNFNVKGITSLKLNCDEFKGDKFTVAKGVGGNEKRCNPNKELAKALQAAAKANNNPAITQQESEKLSKQLMFALRNTDRTIWINNDKINTYKDLEAYCPHELLRYQTIYNELLEANHVRINQTIEDIKYKANKDDASRDELRLNISLANSTDMRSPDILTKKMFNKFSDYKGTLLDCCAGLGSYAVYARDRLGWDVNKIWLIELEETNFEILRMLGFKNIICGDVLTIFATGSAKRVTLYGIEQDVNSPDIKLRIRDMMFDKIIMNPPYDGNLHLKILNEVFNHITDNGEIVCLHPARWAQSVTSKTDYSWLNGKIKNLEYLSYKQTNKLFRISMSDLLIATLISKNGKSIEDFNKFELRGMSPLCQSIYNKIKKQMTATIKNYALKTNTENFVVVNELNSRAGDVTKVNYLISDCHAHIYNNISEYRSGNSSNGGNGERWSIHFNSEKEANNFIMSTCTKAYRFFMLLTKVDVHVHFDYLPYMGESINPRTGLKGYEGEWTDADFYKFFNLTPEEINTIETTMKDYK